MVLYECSMNAIVTFTESKKLVWNKKDHFNPDPRCPLKTKDLIYFDCDSRANLIKPFRVNY